MRVKVQELSLKYTVNHKRIDKVSDSKNKKIETIDCFVIMPISNQINYEENHFTLVYEDIIKPSIIDNNMIPIRADETKNTNLIQLDILKNIIQSPIAICDMSSKNPNVFYELGMRQAFDLPTVLLIDDETKVPFDISGLRYVTYKKNMSYRNVKMAISNLTNALKETYEKRNDKTEINSLIRLMELTSAKIETSTISKSEKIELLHELELKEIKSSIKQLVNMQNSIINKIDYNSSSIPFELNSTIRRNNLKYDFSIGETLYINGKEYGKVIDLTNHSMILKNESGEIKAVPIGGKLYQNLSSAPF